MTDAIFVQAEWLVFFPAVIIGMCVASLVFLWIERKIITNGIWFSFIMRDLLWIAIAVRRILILDQSDAVIVILEFVVVCFLAYSTLKTFYDKRNRIVIGRINQRRESELEEAYYRPRREEA